ncbi:MAG: hypothetical protein U0800_27650 [Isosphaeraceae bacterium]
MKPRSALLAFGILGIAIPAVAQDGREAIRVVAVHPDRQLAALLDLFRGARVPHPPAALVGWKKATGRSLEKSTEAAITLLHPWNIDEFRRLDGAEMAVRFGGGPGPISWWLRIPKDDGAAAAIATALALTDGGRDLPIDGRPVDRLGPPGSALMTTLDDGPTLAASGRETLALAIDPGRGPHPDAGEMSSGFVARIVPGSVGFPDALRPRQAIELIRGLGADEIRLETGLEADSWFARCRTRLEAPPEAAAALEPGWLDDLPGEGVFAAGAVAIDPRPASWNALFRAVDRAIHADPEQANVAPIRARLSTITLPRGSRSKPRCGPGSAGSPRPRGPRRRRATWMGWC